MSSIFKISIYFIEFLCLLSALVCGDRDGVVTGKYGDIKARH